MRPFKQVYPDLEPDRIYMLLNHPAFHALLELRRKAFVYGDLMTTLLNQHLAAAFTQLGQQAPKQVELECAELITHAKLKFK
jgi:hypothetical protein